MSPDRPRPSLPEKAVVLADGKAGTVEDLWLDELRGLRIAIKGPDGKRPVSTMKFAQRDFRHNAGRAPLWDSNLVGCKASGDLSRTFSASYELQGQASFAHERLFRRRLE